MGQSSNEIRASDLQMMSGLPKIIFDISSIARWTGPPVGIARVHHALATHAFSKRSDILMSVYDQATSAFRSVKPLWANKIVDWNGSLEIRDFKYRRDPRRLRNWLPSRYSIIMVLERVRLTVTSAAVCWAIDGMQRLILLSRRMPVPFANKAGERLAVVPAKLALDKPLSLARGDVIVSAGFDWYHIDPATIYALKQRHGIRFVVMCYDIIPLLFPDFYHASDVADFRRFWDAVFSLADQVIVNSRRVQADVRTYCHSIGVIPPAIAITPLGYDPPAIETEKPVPTELREGHYILFVSTIEPRKGHAQLLRVWRRLCSLGIPQRNSYKLVLVGRRGWLVEEVLKQIDEARSSGTVFHFTDLADDELEALFRSATFCVYPSQYEGFGLPIVEAFSYGKAVITSTGGALPETVNGLSPCLDPSDEDAWFEQLKCWIENPGARKAYEMRIQQLFCWPNWDEAATRFFATIAP